MITVNKKQHKINCSLVLNNTLGDSIMIMYVVTVKEDGVVTNTFKYTNEAKADKTVADSKLNGYEVIKETIQIND